MTQTISFTRRYIVALLIIACLSVLAYYNMNHLISNQSNDGKIINLSSKQGMLSQQIALFAIYYKTENLRTNIAAMEEAHQLLISFPMTDELKKIYFDEPYKLDKNVQAYLFHAKRFEENRDGRSLTYILQNAQKLLEALDLATAVYVKTTEETTIKLKNVEFYIFIFTLITLLFEALFIFRPANKKIIEFTQEIFRQQDYANSVIESNSNAIITLNYQLRVKTFNQMAEKIFGYTKEEMLDQLFFDKAIPMRYMHMLTKDTRKVTLRDILAIENKEEVKTIEGVNKNGDLIPIRLSIATSGQHSAVLIIISIQDISKETLKDKIMMQQSKFAALGEMIAIIAHQWRQPLAQLSFNCMYIRNKLKDPDLIEETAKNEEIIQFMSETITNFENFYKHTDSTLFSPNVSIVQTLNLLDSSIRQNAIHVTKNLLDEHSSVYGNSNSLAQVILSIIQNSIDIFKNLPIEHPHIDITLTCDEKDVFISISDNAGGIQEAHIGDIFKPFHSNKIKPSTGIGLYMSKLIIENQFHGLINAYNRENGATFSIQLPKK